MTAPNRAMAGASPKVITLGDSEDEDSTPSMQPPESSRSQKPGSTSPEVITLGDSEEEDSTPSLQPKKLPTVKPPVRRSIPKYAAPPLPSQSFSKKRGREEDQPILFSSFLEKLIGGEVRKVGPPSARQMERRKVDLDVNDAEQNMLSWNCMWLEDQKKQMQAPGVIFSTM